MDPQQEFRALQANISKVIEFFANNFKPEDAKQLAAAYYFGLLFQDAKKNNQTIKDIIAEHTHMLVRSALLPPPGYEEAEDIRAGTSRSTAIATSSPAYRTPPELTKTEPDTPESSDIDTDDDMQIYYDSEGNEREDKDDEPAFRLEF